MTSIPRCASIALAFLFASGCSDAQSGPTGPATPTIIQGSGPAVAFVDVNVLTMTSSTLLQHRTVVVDGGTIVALGSKDSVSPPAGATVIQGAGVFTLLPGLVDAHTHSAQLVDLAANLANGVTTILNMGQSANSPVMRARDSILAGTRPGPRVYGGWFIDGVGGFAGVVSTPDQARAQVVAAKNARHEFIKVYNFLTAAQFDAIVDEAGKQGIAVIGHDVRAVGFPQALGRQVMAAHAEEFIPNYFNGAADVTRARAAATATKSTGAYVTANTSAYEKLAEQWGDAGAVARYLALPEAAYLSPQDRALWPTRGYGQRAGSIGVQYEFVRATVREMQGAGVPLLAGTDTPFVPGLFPGFAMYHELRTMVASGLTTYEALSAATRVPGEFFARHAKGPLNGIVAIGARADLILVRGNPLTSLDVLREPAVVVAGGKWYDRATLMSELERVARP